MTTTEAIQIASVINAIIQTILIIGGIVIAWRYFLHLAPRIDLRLSPRWISGIPNICILTIEITNTSKVKISKEHLLFQALFYPASRIESLNEWVPFNTMSIPEEHMQDEWRNPKAICTTSTIFYPGETTKVDYPIVFPGGAFVGHVGVQLHAKFSFWERVLSTRFKPNEQWTTTIFISPPHE